MLKRKWSPFQCGKIQNSGESLDLGRWLLLVIIAWILWRKLVKPQRKTPWSWCGTESCTENQLQVKDDVDEAELDDEARRKQARKRVGTQCRTSMREMAERSSCRRNGNSSMDE